MAEINNLAGNKAYDDLRLVCHELRLPAPKSNSVEDFVAAFNAVNEKMNPIFDFPPKVVSRAFNVGSVELSISADAGERLSHALENCRLSDSQGILGGDVVKKVAEISALLSTNKGEAARLMIEMGAEPRAVSAYLSGKLDNENAMRLILKKVEFPDFSPLAWNVVDRIDSANPGARALFERYAEQGENAAAGGLGPNEKNELFAHIREFDDYLQDYLAEQNLGSLAPRIRDSEAFKAITSVGVSIREGSGTLEKNMREMRLMFSPHYRMADAFFGRHAGECLGANVLARKDIVNATLFQNGYQAGGVLLLQRSIYGSKSLIVIGVDPSVSVTSGISGEKANEICHWMLSEVQAYAQENGYNLYITRQAGGITNRNLKFEKYFGLKKIPLVPPTHVGSYSVLGVSNFVLPKNA